MTLIKKTINKNYIRPRKLALDILFFIIYKNKYSNILLQEIDTQYILMEKDKKLIYKIVYGTLQNKIFLEFIIDKFINVKKTDNKIRTLLLMSLYQLHFLSKIPPYAVVNEACEISKSINIKFCNFVNAVLNKILSLENITKLLDNSNMNQTEKFLINYSMPKWIFNIIKEQFPKDDIQKFIENNNVQPKLSYRVNTNKINFDKFMALFSKRYFFIKSDVSNSGIISSKPLIKTPLFYEGYIMAQDEMSQRISEILDPDKNDFVLDMCSAPGGKTTHISQLMENHGKIDAIEISRKKIPLIEENIKRLNCLNININNIDANNYKSKILYDKILLDPPCSGLGVIKRKPEIKYNVLKKSNIKDLLKIQESLLKKAISLLKVDGVLVYSTCTINYNENEGMIKKILDQFNNLKIIKQDQIFGFEKNTDGFYYCKLLKIS